MKALIHVDPLEALPASAGETSLSLEALAERFEAMDREAAALAGTAASGVPPEPLDTELPRLDYDEDADVALALVADSMGVRIPKTIDALVPYLGEVVLGLRLIRDSLETRMDYRMMDWNERQRINVIKTLYVLQRFGVGTVLTLAGGALGASVLPLVGGLLGAGGGSLAGGYLNRRLQPQMLNLALAVARLDRADLFYLRNKPVLDRLAASLQESADRLHEREQTAPTHVTRDED